MPPTGPVTTWTRAYLRYTAVPQLEEKDDEFERLHPRDRRGRFRRKPWSVLRRHDDDQSGGGGGWGAVRRVRAATSAAPARSAGGRALPDDRKVADAFTEADEAGQTHPDVAVEEMAERAAIIQKRHVMETLTARLAHVPDEELINSARWRDIQEVRAGRAVWLRTPLDTGSLADPDGEFLHPIDDALNKAVPVGEWEQMVRDGRVPADAELVESIDDLIAWHRSSAVARLVSSWAETSNGDSPMAHALQETARRLFGLDQAAGWDERLQEGFDDDLASHLDRWGRVYEEFLRAMWEETQEWFAARSIRQVVVFRGMTMPASGGWEDSSSERRTYAVLLRPMSSFATDESIAEEFAEHYPQIPHGAPRRVWDHLVLRGVVPVERIIGCPMTGFGCLAEREMVVLAGPGVWEVELLGQSEM